MTALYNEIDPKAAAWLRELIRQGHIAPGDVSETSIEDLTPDDVRGYTQVHFFAGIGVWSYALRRAGWPDDRPIWTGSCPCQPFSAAGKGGGFADERHLWPAFHWLIEQCRPPVVAGEQVASKDGLAWLDLVQADLEGSGYAVGAVDTCAAGFGAPHIRQRLYWLADAPAVERERQPHVQPARIRPADDFASERRDGLGDHSAGISGLADADDARPQGRSIGGDGSDQRLAGASGMAGGVAYAKGIAEPHQPERLEPDLQSRAVVKLSTDDGTDGGTGCGADTPRSGASRAISEKQVRSGSAVEQPGATNGLWRDADWLFCRDGKWRPVEPGTFPLAHGAAERVGRLRGYGNGLNAAHAQAFIEAYLETEADQHLRLTETYGLANDIFS